MAEQITGGMDDDMNQDQKPGRNSWQVGVVTVMMPLLFWLVLLSLILYMCLFYYVLLPLLRLPFDRFGGQKVDADSGGFV